MEKYLYLSPQNAYPFVGLEVEVSNCMWTGYETRILKEVKGPSYHFPFLCDDPLIPHGKAFAHARVFNTQENFILLEQEQFQRVN